MTTNATPAELPQKKCLRKRHRHLERIIKCRRCGRHMDAAASVCGECNGNNMKRRD